MNFYFNSKIYFQLHLFSIFLKIEIDKEVIDEENFIVFRMYLNFRCYYFLNIIWKTTIYIRNTQFIKWLACYHGIMRVDLIGATALNLLLNVIQISIVKHCLEERNTVSNYQSTKQMKCPLLTFRNFFLGTIKKTTNALVH